MPSDFACAQRVTGAGAVERYALAGGHAQERQIELPTSHVRLTPRTPLRVHQMVTAVLRILVKVVYLFPLLLVPKIALWVTDNWYGDLITVAFVVLVVAVFLGIAIATLTHLWVGPRSKRHEMLRPELALPGSDGLDRFARALLPAQTSSSRAGEPVRLRGRVRAGLATGEVVLKEHWSAGPDVLVRLFEGRSFVVDPEDGPVVVVELSGCPVLLGGDVGSSVPELSSAGLSRDLGCDPNALDNRARRALHEGDEVELCARAAQPLDRLEDERLAAVVASAAEGSPYRAGQAGGKMVCVTPSEPVFVRVIGRAAAARADDAPRAAAPLAAPPS